MGWKKKKKKNIMRLERESVIPILKPKIISTLTNLIENKADRLEFGKFCHRVDSAIRAWYLLQFEDLMHLYSLFDPITGAVPSHLDPSELDEYEHDFMKHLIQVMEKSNFRIATDEEIFVALSAQYRLNLPIQLDERKLDTRLLTSFFAENPHENLPYFANKYIIFRRGTGIDRITAYFIQAKINTIISRTWRRFMKYTGLKRLLFGKSKKSRNKPEDDKVDVNVDSEEVEDMYVERIHIEDMNLSICNLLGKRTIQEPTFERIIVLYRRVSKLDHERNIYVKHFKNIPMADLEIVLPEKKNPTLTPIDWLKFVVSASIGLVTVVSSLQMPKADLRVISAILSAVVGYCVKTYFTFQTNLVRYQNLITRCVYDKQLDSGRSTLLRLCDDVIQQEVKEVIVSFFVLMHHGQASKQEIDMLCEELIKKEFGKTCNFEVDDAVQKLDKLGIVSQDESGNYSSVELRHANQIIGTTTEELVLKAKKGTAP